MTKPARFITQQLPQVRHTSVRSPSHMTNDTHANAKPMQKLSHLLSYYGNIENWKIPTSYFLCFPFLNLHSLLPPVISGHENRFGIIFWENEMFVSDICAPIPVKVNSILFVVFKALNNTYKKFSINTSFLKRCPCCSGDTVNSFL